MTEEIKKVSIVFDDIPLINNSVSAFSCPFVLLTVQTYFPPSCTVALRINKVPLFSVILGLETSNFLKTWEGPSRSRDHLKLKFYILS